MNNPYPTPYELRVERETDRILREQSEAVAAYSKGLKAFMALYDSLDFPLGSPCQHFDLAGINGMLGDLSILADDNEALAIDLAREAA